MIDNYLDLGGNSSCIWAMSLILTTDLLLLIYLSTATCQKSYSSVNVSLPNPYTWETLYILLRRSMRRNNAVICWLVCIAPCFPPKWERGPQVSSWHKNRLFFLCRFDVTCWELTSYLSNVWHHMRRMWLVVRSFVIVPTSKEKFLWGNFRNIHYYNENC